MNTSLRTTRTTVVPILLAALLAGCVGTTDLSTTGAEPDQLNLVDPGEGYLKASRAFTRMDAPYSRAGTRLGLDKLRKLALGQDRATLEKLIGGPVAEGDSVLEYNLSLPTAGEDRLICQLHVHFDARGKVQGTVWRRPQCADLVTLHAKAG